MSRSGCEARQQSDQMRCERCNLVWDMNDIDPPECKPKETAVRVARRRALQQMPWRVRNGT